jgi:hypothetical protein
MKVISCRYPGCRCLIMVEQEVLDREYEDRLLLFCDCCVEYLTAILNRNNN